MSAWSSHRSCDGLDGLIDGSGDVVADERRKQFRFLLAALHVEFLRLLEDLGNDQVVRFGQAEQRQRVADTVQEGDRRGLDGGVACYSP
jgi:hypothetical protein